MNNFSPSTGGKDPEDKFKENSMSFKPKDIVQNEWRETYDRELDTGVIIQEESPDHFLVARIAKDDKGWYFTGQDVHERPGQFLTATDIKFEDTGLEI